MNTNITMLDRAKYEKFLNRCLFATPVKRLRDANELTQNQVAGRSSRQELSLFEKKKLNVTISTLNDFMVGLRAFIRFIDLDGKIYKQGVDFTDYRTELTTSQFSEPVKRRRKELKLSQSALAQRAGLTGQAVISNFEANKANITIDTLASICNSLGLRPQIIERYNVDNVYEFNSMIPIDKLPASFIQVVREAIN